MRPARRRPLTTGQIELTATWLAAQQEPSGAIPWSPGGKMDPWDHVHSAMGLAAGRRLPEAAAAFRYLARTQEADGAWAAERRAGVVTDTTHESNHAAYLATGLWHLHLAHPDVDFLAEMWPTLERAIDFVVRLQDESGAISWAVDPRGLIWRAPLLTGSASIHGSLVCAIRIAERLDHDRPAWRQSRARLATVLRGNMGRFDDVDLPEAPGRYSMDWYYPVLGGALRGRAGRSRLLDPVRTEAFLTEGVGLRCVHDRPWYTVAESTEFVLALDACGLTSRAWQILSWMRPMRTAAGAYHTGATQPDGTVWPAEDTSWTGATVLLAADALADDSATSGFFRSLAGTDLDAATERPTGTDEEPDGAPARRAPARL